MCHQSVGLISRTLEAAGYPTLGFSSALSITRRVNPPRVAFLDVPLGHTTGPPNDADIQRRILTDGLTTGRALDKPGVVELPYRWCDDDWKRDGLSWSRKRQAAGTSGQPGGDTRTARSSEPQYQSDADREAAAAVPWGEQCLVCVGVPAPD